MLAQGDWVAEAAGGGDPCDGQVGGLQQQAGVCQEAAKAHVRGQAGRTRGKLVLTIAD